MAEGGEGPHHGCFSLDRRGAHESALVQSPFLALHRHLAALRQTRSRVRSLCPPPRDGRVGGGGTSTWGGLGGWPSGGGGGKVEVAKYVVEMGWPMNAVARRLGILLIFFPPHAGAEGGGGRRWWLYDACTRARLIKRPERGLTSRAVRTPWWHASPRGWFADFRVSIGRRMGRRGAGR